MYAVPKKIFELKHWVNINLQLEQILKEFTYFSYASWLYKEVNNLFSIVGNDIQIWNRKGDVLAVQCNKVI